MSIHSGRDTIPTILPGSPRPGSDVPDIETASDAYARRFAGPVGEYFLDVQTRLLLDLVAGWDHATILDVGGGHAQIVGPLVRQGHRVVVTGSDDSCRRRLDDLLPEGDFEFRRCSLLSLPFGDRRFDVVTAFRLMAHVGQWRHLVAELCRVARHAVILDYPDRRSFNFFESPFFALKRAIERNTRPFRCFTRPELEEEFSELGFPDLAFRPEFFVPMAVHRVVNRVAFSSAVESVGRRLYLTAVFGSPVVVRAVRSPRG